MNEKIRNILLLISVVIVLAIFIDLIFNIYGNKVENFYATEIGKAYNDKLEKVSSDLEGEDYSTVSKENIKSIVSKHDGRMFNVSYINSDPEQKTIIIPSPVKDNANISVNNDGTLSETLKMSSKSDQQFQLIEVNGPSDYQDLFPEYKNDRGASLDSAHYPFWIIKSNKIGFTNWCLAYEPGKLFLSPIGNYNNQKWDVSNLRNPKKSVITHCVSNNSLGSFNNSAANDPLNKEVHDPNKIKINLNLTDELKKQLFPDIELGKDSDTSGEEFTGNANCGTQIPGSALGSICPGCDHTRIHR